MNRFEFVDGEIRSDYLSLDTLKLQVNPQSGAHSIFLGQVRNDQLEIGEVVAIEYTAKQEMAELVMKEIMTDCQHKFNTHAIKVFHSLGHVKTGGLCLLVYVACKNRKRSFEACEYLVERLKKELPVWGKEISDTITHQWKKNN